MLGQCSVPQFEVPVKGLEVLSNELVHRSILLLGNAQREELW